MLALYGRATPMSTSQKGLGSALLLRGAAKVESVGYQAPSRRASAKRICTQTRGFAHRERDALGVRDLLVGRSHESDLK